MCYFHQHLGLSVWFSRDTYSMCCQSWDSVFSNRVCVMSLVQLTRDEEKEWKLNILWLAVLKLYGKYKNTILHWVGTKIRRLNSAWDLLLGFLVSVFAQEAYGHVIYTSCVVPLRAVAHLTYILRVITSNSAGNTNKAT
jgi:hypothetical protein